ncbi:Uncharacterized protein dnl_01750 [Desulfonema limicola]|uniref:Uncharacterized protein n=1 Tax=Desulfonema limicola TaxID=45656 RepID=A0A975B396_9BACT|nr:Uncharacterized protein dnl_01750 [Desulfonema limicola]
MPVPRQELENRRLNLLCQIFEITINLNDLLEMQDLQN